MRTVVFIVGLGYTGSTVLDMALGNNKESFSLGEIANLPTEININNPCVCGEFIRNCHFWLGVCNAIREKHNIDFIRNPDSFPLKPAEIRNRNNILRKLKILSNVYGISKNEPWLKNTKILYDAIAEMSNAKVLIDSSKDIRRALMLRSVLKGYQIKFIHLIRDCRGTMRACKNNVGKVRFPKSNEDAIITRPFIPTEQAIKMWIHDNLKITVYLSLFAPYNSWRVVKYEDYCDTPDTVFSSLAEWLDLSDYKDMINFSSIVHHNVSGSRSRFNHSKILPSDKRWKNDLTEEDFNIFKKKAIFLNRLYGYKD
ncbi:MAG: hypothetical protein HUU08_11680 [Candidatus Brocadia sp.]|nr:hypothetical protein [Candidatus Brocadia sp.]